MRTRILAGSLLLALPLVVLAQPAQPDTLTALLNEVRQLRLALERSASTGPQIQLLGSRLSIQNERLSRAARELDAGRATVTRASASAARLSAAMQEIEQQLATTGAVNQRKELEVEQRALKDQLAHFTAEEQSARLRESELANTLATEQANWNELNRRLDELEKALASGASGKK